jgi:hypothetical protein
MVNKEFEMMLAEAVVAKFAILSWCFFRATEKSSKASVTVTCLRDLPNIKQACQQVEYDERCVSVRTTYHEKEKGTQYTKQI